MPWGGADSDSESSADWSDGDASAAASGSVGDGEVSQHGASRGDESGYDFDAPVPPPQLQQQLQQLAAAIVAEPTDDARAASEEPAIAAAHGGDGGGQPRAYSQALPTLPAQQIAPQLERRQSLPQHRGGTAVSAGLTASQPPSGAVRALIDANTELLRALMGDEADEALASLRTEGGDTEEEGAGLPSGASVAMQYAPGVHAPTQQYVDVTAMVEAIRDLKRSNAKLEAELEDARDEMAWLRAGPVAAMDAANERAAAKFRERGEELAAVRQALAVERHSNDEAESDRAATEAALHREILRLEAALEDEKAAGATAEAVARDALLELEAERAVSRELYTTIVAQAADAQTQPVVRGRAQLALHAAASSATPPALSTDGKLAALRAIETRLMDIRSRRAEVIRDLKVEHTEIVATEEREEKRLLRKRAVLMEAAAG